MSYKYYSPLRPLSLGTFPKPQGNEILHIENFKERQNVPEIARQAWGYIEYKEALTEIEAAAYELIPSNYISEMEDKNGQPIGRTNYGVNGEETYRFMGKNVETVEDDVLPSWDDANEGDVIAVFMNFSDYVINTNMEMQVVKWTDHDNNKISVALRSVEL